MLYELSQLAIRNLLRARARLIMTAGGVLVGTTAVTLLVALTFGLQRAAEASIGQYGSLTEIQVYPNWGFGRGDATEEVRQLDFESVRDLWRIPGVLAVIPMANLQSGMSIEADDMMGGSQVIGIDPQYLPYLGVEVQQGTLSLNPGEVLLGANVGDYFSDPEAGGDEYVPVTVDLFNTPADMMIYSNTGMDTRKLPLKPSGMLRPGYPMYDYAIFMPIDEVLKLNEWASGQRIDPDTFHYDMVTIRTRDRETTNSVSEAIKDLGFMPQGIGELLNQLNGFFGTMRLMLGGVGGVALLVAAFGVANTMTMAILERTKEIGLMKAIGATDREVLTIFLIEAGLVGLVGGVTGLGLSYFLQNLINEAVKALSAGSGDGGGSMGFMFVDPTQLGGGLVIISPELALFAIALATSVGIGAGLYPALRAARLAPVIALKTE